MNKYFYDLHIHSCLSPCGDDDMTPENIAGMAALKGLGIVALTDHNSCKTVPHFRGLQKNGIIPWPEPKSPPARTFTRSSFSKVFAAPWSLIKCSSAKRTLIKNRPDIFGRQIIYGENDEPFWGGGIPSFKRHVPFDRTDGGICEKNSEEFAIPPTSTERQTA